MNTKVTLVQLIEQRPFLTERWIRRLVNERRIPFHKCGGKLVFDLVEIDKWVESGRVEARPAGASK